MHCFHTSAAIVVDGRVGRDVWLYVRQLETELLNVSAVAQLHRPRSQLESVVHICNTVRNFTIVDQPPYVSRDRFGTDENLTTIAVKRQFL